jgi:hypothetical protein
VTITGANPTYNTAAVTFSVDAGGGTASCSMTATGVATVNGSCSSLMAKSLKPSTKYTFTVTAKNAAGSVAVQRAVMTDALYGTARCINGAEGATKTYCQDEPDRRNGNEIFSVADQNDTYYVGWVATGTRLKTYCKVSGDNVDSYIYNSQKQSTWWIQIDFDGKNYIPWAWLNLDGGDDDVAILPTC